MKDRVLTQSDLIEKLEGLEIDDFDLTEEEYEEMVNASYMEGWDEALQEAMKLLKEYFQDREAGRLQYKLELKDDQFREDIDDLEERLDRIGQGLSPIILDTEAEFEPILTDYVCTECAFDLPDQAVPPKECPICQSEMREVKS